MIYTITKYNSTSSLDSPTASAWPTKPITWPTWVMLGAAAVAVAFNSMILLAYMCSHNAANRMSTIAGIVSVLFFFVQAGIWIVTVGAFKIAAVKGNNRDIWSYTCSTVADNVQELFQSQVNFDIFCKTNTASFWIAVGQVAMEVFALVIYAFSFYRLRTKSKVKRASAVTGT